MSSYWLGGRRATLKMKIGCTRLLGLKQHLQGRVGIKGGWQHCLAGLTSSPDTAAFPAGPNVLGYEKSGGVALDRWGQYRRHLVFGIDSFPGSACKPVAACHTNLPICVGAPISASINTRACIGRRVEDDWIRDFNAELELVFGGKAESHSLLGGEQTLRKNFKGDVDKLTASSGNSVMGDSILNNSFKEEILMDSDIAASKFGVLEAEDAIKIESLSHVNSAGKAAMVNVIEKANSKRVAVATGEVFLGLTAFNLVAANHVSKGDVLTVAKIAGIQGAKQTSSLIPLCHNILLSGVDVTLILNEETLSVDIRAEATTSGPTGVEMEALTAVSVASLTVYDMCKAVSKDITISKVQLESKTGGKSGDWFRQKD